MTRVSSIVDPLTAESNGHPQVAPAASVKPKAPDPFDLGSLRLSQDFAANLGVRKALLTVPTKKPSREWWVRTHPDPAYRIETMVLELKEDRECYIVTPNLWPELATESTFSPRAIYTAVNTQGVVFLWPVRLPGSDGKIDDWNRSAMEAATMASEQWVRVQANMSLGAYDVTTCDNDKQPAWPETPFQDLLRIGFKGKVIDTMDHPVLKRLRGEL